MSLDVADRSRYDPFDGGNDAHQLRPRYPVQFRISGLSFAMFRFRAFVISLTR